jgi:hypothetical protein
MSTKMRALPSTPTPAVRGRGSKALTLPVYPPGQLWVSGFELDAEGTLLQVYLLNDAMAPGLPAGTVLQAWQVQAEGPLTPGVYLVRWPEGTPGCMSYVGRLLAEDISPEQLIFSFDGVIPEPVLCSIWRQLDSPVRLYRVRLQSTE